MDGEKRLQDVVGGGAGSRSAPSPNVAEFQQQIDDLVRERELLIVFQTRISKEQPGEWCAEGPPCVKEVPPIPQDHAELEGWTSERNCDLRNALGFGDAATIFQIGTLSSQGIAQFAPLDRCCDGRPVKAIVDGVDDRGVGRQEKVGAGGFSSSGLAIDVGKPSVRDRYGLRGV